MTEPQEGRVLYSLLEFAFLAIMASSDAAASAGQRVRDGPASVALPFLRTGSALAERASMAPVSAPAILVEDLILLCLLGALQGRQVRNIESCRSHNRSFSRSGGQRMRRRRLALLQHFPMTLTARLASYTCLVIGHNLG